MINVDCVAEVFHINVLPYCLQRTGESVAEWLRSKTRSSYVMGIRPWAI
jgi:hypothetical protein